MKFTSIKFIFALALFLGYAVFVGGPTVSAAPAQPVGNKICPISGDKIKSMGKAVKIDYKGKTYNLCCKMCVKDFNKDPEKFSKKVEAEVKSGKK